MKIKLAGWFNWNHLRVAERLNGGNPKSGIVNYFIHMRISLREAVKQLLMAGASVIHAFLPFLFNFKLLEIVVNQTRGLYKFLPQHPIWEDLRKELNEQPSRSSGNNQSGDNTTDIRNNWPFQSYISKSNKTNRSE